MPSTIRIRTDRISADLAAGRLREEGIQAEVISDSDMLGGVGVPMHFNLIVPAPYEDLASRHEPMTTVPSSGVYGAKAPPYFLFASSGKWLLELRDGSTAVGRAVLLVR